MDTDAGSNRQRQRTNHPQQSWYLEFSRRGDEDDQPQERHDRHDRQHRDRSH